MSSNYLLDSAESLTTIIFDLDNTLLDWSKQAMPWDEYLMPAMQNVTNHLNGLGHAVGSVEQVALAFRGTIRHAYANADPENEAVSLAKMLQTMCVSELGLATDSVNIQALMRAISWQPMPGVTAFDDTIAVLSELRDRGFKLGLITNAFQPMWMRDIELKVAGIIEFFDIRITSGDTGFMKPHPAIFWRMLGLLDSRPDRAMYVGDSPSHDVEGANRTGLTSVLFDPPHLDREIGSAEPDFHITTLTELLPIVEQLS